MFALDGLNQLLRSADPDNFEGFHARTDREVALFGHSFGGATVAACVLRDGTLGTRARFSHCFLFDPWIGGAACPLAESELHARRLTSELRTLRVWLKEVGHRKDAEDFRMHIFRRGHALDIQRAGGTLKLN